MARYFSEQTLLDMRDQDMNYVYDLTDLEQYLAGVPTADVVPKSEVERLENTYSRAVRKADKKAIVAIQNAKQEVAREIFEEIEKNTGFFRVCAKRNYDYLCIFCELDKLKKKYTEEV